jgi:hypothetical protein
MHDEVSSDDKMRYIENSIFKLPTKNKSKVRGNFQRIKILTDKGMVVSADRLRDDTYSYIRKQLLKH